jgi:hypothetical protein
MWRHPVVSTVRLAIASSPTLQDVSIATVDVIPVQCHQRHQQQLVHHQ